MYTVPFTPIDWFAVEKKESPGASGTSWSRTQIFDGLRIRLVEYSAGYLADHWCEKGHIVFCLEGEFLTELKSGELIQLKSGMSFMVSDELSSHRSSSENGVTLLIIDGAFLNPEV